VSIGLLLIYGPAVWWGIEVAVSRVSERATEWVLHHLGQIAVLIVMFWIVHRIEVATGKFFDWVRSDLPYKCEAAPDRWATRSHRHTAYLGL
jgi:hypothetical protein